MATTTWLMRRHPNMLSGRFRRSRHTNKEDDINFDIQKDPRQNVTNILLELCQVSEMTDGKRLNYLNAFVKVTLRIEGNFENIGFKIEDILHCLRATLIHESTQIRSGGLRAIRHILRNENDVIQLNKLLIPFLISRSLDLVLKNDVERIEAMKLTRKILLLAPNCFHVSLARSLVALANGGIEEKDRMLRICLATLCELGVMNADLFIETGGLTAITRNLLECHTPKISESLCGVILLLLDKPMTRGQAAVDLHSIAAPYCDFHYRRTKPNSQEKSETGNGDEREMRFNCSRLALLSILRSWPGILHFCGPANKAGLRAIVEVLYINQLEVRKAVLDLLYELLGLPQPEWTDELSVALSAVDPCEPQSSWRLNEGFVAAEGRSILPHLAKTTPSIIDMHLALLLYCFAECGLLGAIVEVIATSDTFISVRATVLLGELLHLIQLILPSECCNISPALPTLLEYATFGRPQAIKAVNGLEQLQKMLRARPASYSLHLDYILRSGKNVKTSFRTSKKSRHKMKNFKSRLQQLVNLDGDDVIKDSGVLLNKDAYTWNWNRIRMIVKGEAISLDMSDSSHRNFMKRLVDFYTPSHNRYSHMDLSCTKLSLAYTMTGIDLITCLLELGDVESKRLLWGLFNDISQQISAITSGKSVHDCLFNPQHMNSTQCQSYFLFIGRIAAYEAGVELLQNLSMFKKLEHLALTINNDCYVKLIVSSLDYKSEPCLELLKAIFKCPIESSRLYATQFLLVLLRAGIANFADWGVRLLVSQLEDSSRTIKLFALATLHEACEVRPCLESLVKLMPDFTHLREKGSLLKIRMLSITTGFQLLNQNNYVVNEIVKWVKEFNYRYVKLVEGETSDVLTLHQRDEDGKYDKRTSAVRSTNRKDFFLPPHLYGQLTRHLEGFLMLSRHGGLELMLQCLENAICDTDEDILRLKAALWALGHFGSSTEGVKYLILQNSLAVIVTLAQECLIFSIRATAYYVLGLIASTRQGADELFKLGWFSTRHHRHNTWPIVEEEAWGEENDDSMRINYVLPQRSSDLCFFDSGIKDIEGSTDDDVSETNVGLSETTGLGYQKSLTLPANQNLSSGYHKRSLSESKTFEMIRSHDGRVKDKGSFRLGAETSRRVRNNSTTESTTSGVSSCDSGCGPKSFIYEHQKILSPIPSSCSLSTLKQPGQKIRRHSESSRRVSVQSGSNSDRSSYSLSGNATNKLSHQDLVGYATLRSLRRFPRYLEEPPYVSEKTPAEVTWDLPEPVPEELISLSSSFPPISNVKRFSVNENMIDEDRCYLGISLPGDIRRLFLDPEDESPPVSGDRFPIIDEDIVYAMRDIQLFQVGKMCHSHDMNACLNCSWSPNKYEEVFTRATDSLSDDCFSTHDQTCDDNAAKSQILNLVDRFSNPIWMKQVKQSLLQCKQRSPQVFQNLCLYSEICKMISESTYRLSPRRMLHELFLEIDYGDFYAETAKVFRSAARVEESDGEATAHGINIKKLDSLKLAYKENKFPIRNRKDSKIV